MNLMKRYKEWKSYRATINELRSLSNRELSDIGIARADIVAVARSAF